MRDRITYHPLRHRRRLRRFDEGRGGGKRMKNYDNPREFYMGELAAAHLALSEVFELLMGPLGKFTYAARGNPNQSMAQLKKDLNAMEDEIMNHDFAEFY